MIHKRAHFNVSRHAKPGFFDRISKLARMVRAWRSDRRYRLLLRMQGISEIDRAEMAMEEDPFRERKSRP